MTYTGILLDATFALMGDPPRVDVPIVGDSLTSDMAVTLPMVPTPAGPTRSICLAT
jgi:hypothetical protein